MSMTASCPVHITPNRAAGHVSLRRRYVSMYGSRRCLLRLIHATCVPTMMFAASVRDRRVNDRHLGRVDPVQMALQRQSRREALEGRNDVRLDLSVVEVTLRQGWDPSVMDLAIVASISSKGQGSHRRAQGGRGWTLL